MKRFEKRYFTRLVPFELAVKLQAGGFPNELDDEGNCYATTDFKYEAEWDGRVTDVKQKELLAVCDGQFPEDSVIPAPSFAEVLDWMINNGYDISEIIKEVTKDR